ncbi:hypothetical protein CRG98_001925 [Punica granatum]|uniref:Uncharacterized protein n=1 Tax=Punica granatum TaxID=22663 RepID=A0A2I0LAI6_PUNGR|nr:hypothetical protein CRG98_001925 [Punica granatum]
MDPRRPKRPRPSFMRLGREALGPPRVHADLLHSDPTLLASCMHPRCKRKIVGEAAVGVARLGSRATGEWPERRDSRGSLRENGSARLLRPRKNKWNGGCARWIGPRILTTSSRGRVRVVRNPLNVMARLDKVLERNGTRGGLGVHPGKEFGDFWFKSGRVDTGIPGVFPTILAGFGLGTGLTKCSSNVPRRSGIAVISVCHVHAPKARREAFVTTETSLGRPSRVPKDHLKLVPQPGGPWVPVGPFPGAVYLLVGRASRSPVRKGLCESLGTPWPKQDTSEMHPDASLVTLAPGGIFRAPYWAPFEWTMLISRDLWLCARVLAPGFPIVNSVPSFGRKSSVGAGGPKWGADTSDLLPSSFLPLHTPTAPVHANSLSLSLSLSLSILKKIGSSIFRGSLSSRTLRKRNLNSSWERPELDFSKKRRRQLTDSREKKKTASSDPSAHTRPPIAHSPQLDFSLGQSTLSLSSLILLETRSSFVPDAHSSPIPNTRNSDPGSHALPQLTLPLSLTSAPSAPRPASSSPFTATRAARPPQTASLLLRLFRFC